MKLYRSIFFGLVSIVVFGWMISACQKLHRPELGEILRDPDPPAYNPLKSYFQFENNPNDEGESKLTATTKNITYVAGISGQAAKIGADGYILYKAVGDTVRYPNEFVGLPVDTLRNLGSCCHLRQNSCTASPRSGSNHFEPRQGICCILSSS